MKKSLAFALALLLMVTSIAFAESVDLSTYTIEELDQLEKAIIDERKSRADDDMTDQSQLSKDFDGIASGKWSENTKTLQHKLIELGYLTGKEDGILGPNSQAALKSLQSALGWEETGTIETQEEFDVILALIPGDGINLALGTEEPVVAVHKGEDNWCRPIGFYPTSDNGLALLADEGNTCFTVSFDWSVTNADTATIVTIGLKNTKSRYSAVGRFDISEGDSSGHFSGIFIPAVGMRQYGKGWLISGMGKENINQGTEVTISNFKFETGAKATVWTSAPEDEADLSE